MRISDWSSDVCSSDLKKDEQKTQLLTEINGSLAEIIRLLGVYLASLPQPEKIDAFRLLMGETIKKSDIVLPTLLNEDQLPGALHVLNFNYTPTAAAYQIGRAHV